MAAVESALVLAAVDLNDCEARLRFGFLGAWSALLLFQLVQAGCLIEYFHAIVVVVGLEQSKTPGSHVDEDVVKLRKISGANSDERGGTYVELIFALVGMVRVWERCYALEYSIRSLCLQRRREGGKEM